jgi:uncharacterized protein YciI
MWYVIHASDREDSLKGRKSVQAEHRARIQLLVDQGRLLAAGPMPNIDSEDPGPAGFSGSVIIADFDSLEDAREWAGADPYVEAGVYQYVDVRPFLKVFP